jgi:hypothetical protein
LANAGDRQEPTTSRRGSCHASHVCVDRSYLRHNGSPCRSQALHGGGEAGHPLACSERLVDEGRGDRAGKPDPKHHRQALDLVPQDYALTDQFLARGAGTLARPGVIRLFGAGGVREAMPIYQSSHRLTWLKIHGFLSGSVPASDLPILNALDAAVIARSFDVA